MVLSCYALLKKARQYELLSSSNDLRSQFCALLKLSRIFSLTRAGVLRIFSKLSRISSWKRWQWISTRFWQSKNVVILEKVWTKNLEKMATKLGVVLSLVVLVATFVKGKKNFFSCLVIQSKLLKNICLERVSLVHVPESVNWRTTVYQNNAFTHTWQNFVKSTEIAIWFSTCFHRTFYEIVGNFKHF